VSTPVDASLPAAGKTDRHFPVLLAAFTTTASADLAISMYQIGRGAAREGLRIEMAELSGGVRAEQERMAAVFAVGLQRQEDTNGYIRTQRTPSTTLQRG
jgi:hypothetical protein